MMFRIRSFRLFLEPQWGRAIPTPKDAEERGLMGLAWWMRLMESQGRGGLNPDAKARWTRPN